MKPSTVSMLIPNDVLRNAYQFSRSCERRILLSLDIIAAISERNEFKKVFGENTDAGHLREIASKVFLSLPWTFINTTVNAKNEVEQMLYDKHLSQIEKTVHKIASRNMKVEREHSSRVDTMSDEDLLTTPHKRVYKVYNELRVEKDRLSAADKETLELLDTMVVSHDFQCFLNNITLNLELSEHSDPSIRLSDYYCFAIETALTVPWSSAYMFCELLKKKPIPGTPDS